MSLDVGAGPFQTRKFSDIAGGLIRDRIMSGELLPGSRLNEVTLSEELKISRPPLREALRALSGEGLVEMVPGRGAFVVSFDLDSVRQLGEIRIALECASARHAASRADAADRARMVELMAAVEAELREPGTPYPHHTEFHAVLADAAHNPRLASTLGEVVRQLRLASMKTNENPDRAHQVLLEHREVVDAVMSGDPARAEQAMRVHIQASNDAIEALLEGSERTRS